MKLSWSQLKDILKAEFVAGDLIANVEGKQQSIGRLSKGKVILSPLGERLAHTANVPAVTVTSAAPIDPPPTARRYPRRNTRKVEPDA